MSNDHRIDDADRSPLQFTTRSLFLAVAVCALVLVVFDQAGAVWGVASVWFLILVAAHVGANVRGSRELDASSAAIAADENAGHGRPARREPPTVDYAPATQLRATTGPGRVLAFVIASGAALGLILGTLALALATRTDYSGIVLGGFSAGVLGGILGFVTGSFVIVSSRAFQEAARDPRSGARVRMSGGCPARSS